MNKKTKILYADQEKDIIEAVAIIKSGELIAVPTETVYGLAADAKNIDAVKKIFIVKNRPSNHPLIVHIGSFEELSEWAKDIPPITALIAKHFWPGPITLLLKKNDAINDVVTGGLDTIAIRIPQNKALLKILHILKTGLAAPSANPHKRISPTSSEHVMSGLSGKIEAVLDDGPCQIGVESTILDLTKETMSILRHGPISKKMIEKVVKVSINSPETHTQSVPGNMKSHYQPYTTTSMMDLAQLEEEISKKENSGKIFGVIHYSNLKKAYTNIQPINLSKNKAQYSQQIYKALHELDGLHTDKILIECPPKKDAWNDIFDRLLRACNVDK